MRGATTLERRGLPPPARESQPCTPRSHWITWSTPAHAGIPMEGLVSPWGSMGLPRPHGGSHSLPRGRAGAPGLPPLTRGSQSTRAGAELEHGSTPACAGIPPHQRTSGGTAQVYPRPCGDPVLHLVEL